MQVVYSVDDRIRTPLMVANHAPTRKAIPIVSRNVWCRINARVLSQYAKASRDNDNQGKLRKIVEWLSIPGDVLKTDRRVGRSGRALSARMTEYYGGRREGDRDVSDSVHSSGHGQNSSSHGRDLLPGNAGSNGIIDSCVDMNVVVDSSLSVSSLVSDSVSVCVVPSLALNDVPNETVKKQLLEDSSVIRANKLVRSGYMTRAARMLANNVPVARIEDEGTRTKLRELHPVPVDRPMPVLNQNMTLNKRHIYSGEDKMFKRMVIQMNDGTAPGPSGWTGALLKDLAKDEECLRGLASLVTDIHNAEIPKEAVEYLTHSNLTPLSKNDRGDIRPIAVGEVILRLVSRLAIRLVTNEINDILLPIQLGVGSKGGCEMIVHNVQYALDRRVRGDPTAVLTIDFKNAFNEIRRDQVMNQLFTHPTLSDLFNVCNMCYESPSRLYVKGCDGVIGEDFQLYSQEGVRQGDTFGPLLFSLGIHPVYKSIQQKYKDVTVQAIMDDLTLTGKPEDLVDAFRMIQEEAKLKTNLQVRPEKCNFMYLMNDVTALSTTIINDVTALGIKIQYDGCIVLGAPVGRTSQWIESEALRMVRSQSTFFNGIRNKHSSVQNAMHLLRTCAVPKLGYLLRTVRPSAMKIAIQSFNDSIRIAALNKLDIYKESAITEAHWNNALRQLTLPVRHGGFGLTNFTTISYIAYYSSVAAAVESNGILKLTNDMHTINPRGTALTNPLLEELTTCLQTIRSETKIKNNSHIFNAVLPDTMGDHGKDFLSKFTPAPAARGLAASPKLQAKLTAQLQLVIHGEFINSVTSIGLGEKARLSAITAKHSSDWIKAVPLMSITTLHDDAYRQAARLRLGLKPHDLIPRSCVVCQANTHSDPWHYLTCQGYRKTLLGARHDTIVKAVQEVVQIAGGAVVCEPPSVSTEDLRRPDHLIALDNKLIYTDVSVTHPTAVSYVSQRQSLNSLQLADKKAQEKIEKYKDIIPVSAEFNPFIVETYGGIGRHAQKLIDQISVHASEHQSVWTENEVGNFLRFAIAINIQRGNARAVNHGYTYNLRSIQAPIVRPRRTRIHL
jgi:hypothetical protein